MYDIEEEKILHEIKRLGLKRVLLQFPEGLKPLGFELAQLIEKQTDAEVFLAGDPCYGACDLSLSATRLVGAELLIHIGHAKFLRNLLRRKSCTSRHDQMLK